MAILIHLDHPNQISVYIDGSVRAHIQKEGSAWLLRPLNNPDKVTDVSALIYRHEVLKPVIFRSLEG